MKIMRKTEKIFMQYSKEPILIKNCPKCHPNLLIPEIQNEFKGRIYRIFKSDGIPISKEPLPEHKVLEIVILLADIWAHYTIKE